MSSKMISAQGQVTDRSDSEPESGWFPQWLSWRPTSNLSLYVSETKLLGRLTSNLERFYVSVLNNSCRLRTIIARSSTATVTPAYNNRVPIVLVHGMGAGVAFWCKNIDSLAAHRPVYAMDVLGFGRSSRPTFPSDPAATEEQFVTSLEDWRQEMELEKFVLIGHSLGGYLSYAYAIKYPQYVAHVILADPWGFPEKVKKQSTQQRGVFLRSLGIVLSHFNPLGILRAAGPFGPMLVRNFRQDLGIAFNDVSDRSDASVALDSEDPSPTPNAPGWLLGEAVMGTDSDLAKAGSLTQYSENDPGCILDYIYHCNAQTPSGEAAFRNLSQPIGWAIRPMLSRAADLDLTVPVTFIYGGRSWMDSQSGFEACYLRGNDTYTDVRIIDGAGHHVYCQGHREFNDFVNSICLRLDSGDTFPPGSQPAMSIMITRHDSDANSRRDSDQNRSSERKKHRASHRPRLRTSAERLSEKEEPSSLVAAGNALGASSDN